MEDRPRKPTEEADERARRTPATGGPAPEQEQPATTAEELERKAKELERLREYVNRTSFAGGLSEAADELSIYDQHPADFADVYYQRELDNTIRRILADNQQQIEEALERQRSGRYGICENCGRPIDPERLAARPEATLCIECQRQSERAATRSP